MKKTLSFDELTKFAIKLSNFIIPNDVIALIGDLGTGKTTFAKIVAKELGVNKNVKSPTFNYVLEYLDGKMPLYHFDVYRLTHPEEVYEIGYEDYLNSGGLTIIEWADIIKSELPKEYIEIKICHNSINSREVRLKFIGNSKREKELYKLW